MIEKTYGNACINCSDDGYMTDLTQWNIDVASDIAQEEEITMTNEHWEVIQFLQDQYKKEVPLTIRRVGKSGVVSIKEFYQLFPNGPLKKASRIAGIPKPVSCI